MLLLLIDNMVINLGGQEIDDQVNQSKYAAADGNTGEKQPGVGHFQCAEAALDHGECEHRMNDCGKQRQEKYSEVASIYRSEPYFIEIMPKDVNKATSLDHMLEGMGLTRENAICCGDGYNDISMIEYAGTGIAMGNAQPAVKEAADYITGTNDEDGLVEVIDKFIMKPEA